MTVTAWKVYGKRRQCCSRLLRWSSRAVALVQPIHWCSDVTICPGKPWPWGRQKRWLLPSAVSIPSWPGQNSVWMVISVIPVRRLTPLGVRKLIIPPLPMLGVDTGQYHQHNITMSFYFLMNGDQEANSVLHVHVAGLNPTNSSFYS